MKTVNLEDIIRWSKGSPDDGKNTKIDITGISTDTRTIKPGSLFIPLWGENHDAHQFISQAVSRGAAAFLYSAPFEPPPSDAIGIKVKDTREAHHRIARFYLEGFNIPVIAITGSNGKTTTKDMTGHILSMRYRVLSSRKNYNNEVGVPMTVLELDDSHEVLVAEMAMRGEGQIAQLAGILNPDVAVITNIGESHFELLGSYEAIARAKCEVMDHLNPAGFAVLNADDRWFAHCSSRSPARVTTFGIKKPSHIRLINYQDMGLEGFRLQVAIEGRLHSFSLPLLGIHNIYNALCSIATALCLRLTIEEIRRGLASLTPSEKRMEVLPSSGGWTVLNDSYNASPSSTARALEILAGLPRTGRKIAVLSDMLELGDIAVESHQKTGGLVHALPIDMLMTWGSLGNEIHRGAVDGGMAPATARHFEKKTQLIDCLIKEAKAGDIILVKGSRGMKMEEVTAVLTGGEPVPR